MKRILMAAAFVIFTASAARADLPLPKDLKYIDPIVRFEGVEKHPDLVFCVRFLTFTGGPANIPHTVREVKNDKPFALGAERRLIETSLLAMDRTEFTRRAKEDPSLKWLSDKTEGVKSAAFPAPSTVGKVADKEVPVTSYRVTIQDGRFSVMQQAKANPGPTSMLPAVGVGIALSLSLASLGIWIARRR